MRKCILAGFSDQIARRLDAATLRCELLHNRRATLSRESAIQNAPLLVASEITEIQGRELATLLTLCTAIKEPWLAELFPGALSSTTTVRYDPSVRRVTAFRQRFFRDLALETTPAPDDQIPPGQAAALLARQVAAGEIVLTEWNETTEQWIARVNTLSAAFPEYEIPPITDADRALLIEQICYGSLGARELKDKPVMPVLRDWLTAEQAAALESVLPEKLIMANGRRARLIYATGNPPVLSARIQELYGIEGRFSLGNGRVPVKIEVLAPNHRPLQITDDLTLFWKETYPEIKPALSRRYPRHEWR
ncbi:MAG: hypothetical protein LBR12_04730 [Opitutaceae bacterium]|nr:hypothetical protein [Opitutaceae bacterium]